MAMKSLAIKRTAGTLALIVWPAFAQSVISSHAGVIEFSDGVIELDGGRLPRDAGRFRVLANGSLLKTGAGSVEVLLSPGAILWLGPNSSLRMQDNSLERTRVELAMGAAVIEVTALEPGNHVTFIYPRSELPLRDHSLLRIDVSATGVQVDADPLTRKPDQLDLWVIERRREISNARKLPGGSRKAGASSGPLPIRALTLPGRR
jgi:hypothetical protein